LDEKQQEPLISRFEFRYFRIRDLEQQGNLESLHRELPIREISKESGPLISQGEFLAFRLREIRGKFLDFED
jgi:hypothetical protein